VIAGTIEPAGVGACASCLRRSWLLAALTVPLDYCARSRDRLLDVLALEDEELVAAVGGRRRAELTRALERFSREDMRMPAGVAAVCRHDPLYPAGANGPAAPRLLFLSVDPRRPRALTESPVVAMLGAARASDYGKEMARSLARGLTASGLTVAVRLGDGIAVAVQTGAREARGATIAVLADGIDASSAARQRRARQQATRAGCVVAELPPSCRGRRFGQVAAERTLVELAAAVIVIEAEANNGELWAAGFARARGRSLAAVPGRVTSSLSGGANALLRDGATLVRDATDVLEQLSLPPRRPVSLAEESAATGTLTNALRTLLERVAEGEDTPEKLCATHRAPSDVLLGLTELELMGLLRRGDAGRYVPCAITRR
jgi:DNA processing protein